MVPLTAGSVASRNFISMVEVYACERVASLMRFGLMSAELGKLGRLSWC